MVPVPNFDKLQVPVPTPYLDQKKDSFQKKFGEKSCLFTCSMLFYKEKIDKFHQIYCKIVIVM
jgi:hypothetical protein